MKFGNIKSTRHKTAASSAPDDASDDGVKKAQPEHDTSRATEAIQSAPGAVSTATEEEGLGGPKVFQADSSSSLEPEKAGVPDKIKKMEEEKAALFDQLLRKQAEFENFRKRTEREKAEFMRFANFEIVRDLLPVLDGFERALKVETGDALEGFKKGMELVYKQLFDGLKKAGLQPFESVGQKFDPNVHQAVVREERHDVEENVVIEEFQRGYLFQGRLLRAAMVKVAVGVAPAMQEQQEAGESGDE